MIPREYPEWTDGYFEEMCPHYQTREIVYEVVSEDVKRKYWTCSSCIGEHIYLLSRYGKLSVERTP